MNFKVKPDGGVSFCPDADNKRSDGDLTRLRFARPGTGKTARRGVRILQMKLMIVYKDLTETIF